MPAVNEFQVQTILNRVFVAATNRLATGGGTGDGAPKILRKPQEIWNNVFDSSNNLLRM